MDLSENLSQFIFVKYSIPNVITRDIILVDQVRDITVNWPNDYAFNRRHLHLGGNSDAILVSKSVNGLFVGGYLNAIDKTGNNYNLLICENQQELLYINQLFMRMGENCL